MMFSRSRKKSSHASVVTPSLLVPLVSSSNSGHTILTVQPTASSSSAPRQSFTANISNDELTAKIENKKRRRSLLGGSRLSVYSLFYPSAYSNRRPKPAGSRSVNDIHNASTSINVEHYEGPSKENDASSASDKESLMTSAVSTAGGGAKTKTRECPLCCVRQPIDYFPTLLSCSHRSCRSCLMQYLQIEISESRIHIACPECNELLHPNDIYKLLVDHKSTIEKYEEFSVRRVLMVDPDTRWCPSPDCNYAVIASGCAACPELKCDRPGCNTLFCYHCKMVWHPSQTCTEARVQRGSSAHSSVHIETTIKRGDIKPCPGCKTYIVKADDGSCNHMTCPMCGSEFCWLCMKEISDLHYLSPSGCTFWAKKPWSRKKKLIWQFGMLIGAPVGIALVAGFAIPAIMFGVPVWIGRKVHAKLKNSSKAKRRIAVVLSVSGSVLMGPALATMAVGVGVPIMLAYVYGVVPLSLCRNGSCGVTASPSGVRLDLDSDMFELNEIVDGSPHEKTQLLASVDRSDVLTLTSARSGSMQNKIQVHAEVAYTTKRRPSIESGGMSLGDRQNYEDASVKALGGSVYCDDKSVHTMGSLIEGGSYCEEHASTKALAGSAICPTGYVSAVGGETKSLCGVKSMCSGLMNDVFNVTSTKVTNNNTVDNSEEQDDDLTQPSHHCDECRKRLVVAFANTAPVHKSSSRKPSDDVNAIGTVSSSSLSSPQPALPVTTTVLSQAKVSSSSMTSGDGPETTRPNTVDNCLPTDDSLVPTTSTRSSSTNRASFFTSPLKPVELARPCCSKSCYFNVNDTRQSYYSRTNCNDENDDCFVNVDRTSVGSNRVQSKFALPDSQTLIQKSASLSGVHFTSVSSSNDDEAVDDEGNIVSMYSGNRNNNDDSNDNKTTDFGAIFKSRHAAKTDGHVVVYKNRYSKSNKNVTSSTTSTTTTDFRKATPKPSVAFKPAKPTKSHRSFNVFPFNYIQSTSQRKFKKNSASYHSLPEMSSNGEYYATDTATCRCNARLACDGCKTVL